MYEKKIIPCMLNRWFKNSFWDVLRILRFFFYFVVTECLSLLIFSNFFYLLNSLRGIHIFLIIMKKKNDYEIRYSLIRRELSRSFEIVSLNDKEDMWSRGRYILTYTHKFICSYEDNRFTAESKGGKKKETKIALQTSG